MAEYLTQSRPYAEAIFEIAEQDNSVDSWIKDLALISTSFQDSLIQALIDTPDISQREKAEKFVSIFEGEVSAKTINFLKTLGQANRLKILDNIILNFLELVAKKRNQKNVVVSSAFDIISFILFAALLLNLIICSLINLILAWLLLTFFLLSMEDPKPILVQHPLLHQFLIYSLLQS